MSRVNLLHELTVTYVFIILINRRLPFTQGLLSHSLMCARREKKDTSLISTNPDRLCQNKFKENPTGSLFKDQLKSAS